MAPVTATCLLAASGSVVVAAVVFVLITVAELALMVWAIMDLTRRRTVTWGNKWIWAVIIVLFGLIGPIVYFVAGRPPSTMSESSDEAARRGAGAAQRAVGAADLLYGSAGEAEADEDEVAGEAAPGEAVAAGEDEAPGEAAAAGEAEPQDEAPAAGDDDGLGDL
jgi:hypothetical protein